MDEKDYKIDRLVKPKSDDPVFHMHEYDIDLGSRQIYLIGVDRGYELESDPEEPGVDYTMANRFIKNLNICMRMSKEPILTHMKTCGGNWIEGMSIYDSIISCPNNVTILSYTHARSMSSIIFQAADKRVMMPNSYFMIHDGTYSNSGTFKQVYSDMAFFKESRPVMLDIYARRMQASPKGEFYKRPLVIIKNWLSDQMEKKEDVFLNAKATVKAGLADEVFNGNWKNLTKY